MKNVYYRSEKAISYKNKYSNIFYREFNGQLFLFRKNIFFF